MKAALGFGIASVVIGVVSVIGLDDAVWPDPAVLASMVAGFFVAPSLATVAVGLVATALRPRRRAVHTLIAVAAVTGWALMATGMVSRRLSLNEQDTTTAIWALGAYWAYAIPLLAAVAFTASLVALIDAGRSKTIAVFGALGVSIAAVVACWPLYLIALVSMPLAAVVGPLTLMVDRSRLSPAPPRASP